MTLILYILFFIFMIVCLITIILLLKTKNQLNKANLLISANDKIVEEQKNRLKKYETQVYAYENAVKEKTRDLIIKSRELDEKNHLIDTIRKKISEAIKNPSKTSNKIHEIDLELDKLLNVEDHTFQMQMDEYHQAFMTRLKNKYPDITVQDQRLCLYIKTGMTSLEIADVMKVLPSSIYISRSRLRKKLGLPIDQDLYGFLTTINI